MQKYNVTTAIPMLKYIVRHDEYTKNPYYGSEKKKKRKGSKGYAVQVRTEKDRKKRRDIKYVLDLIDAVAAV